MNPFLNLVILIFMTASAGALFLVLKVREPIVRLFFGTLFAFCTYVVSVVVLFRVLSSGI